MVRPGCARARRRVKWGFCNDNQVAAPFRSDHGWLFHLVKERCQVVAHDFGVRMIYPNFATKFVSARSVYGRATSYAPIACSSCPRLLLPNATWGWSAAGCI
jgi:hypothetical protein